jgi:hypothetical protein
MNALSIEKLLQELKILNLNFKEIKKMTALNKVDDFKDYLLTVNKNVLIFSNEIGADEESERFESFDEIIEFSECNDVQITNIWKVTGGKEYYEANFIDLN